MPILLQTRSPPLVPMLPHPDSHSSSHRRPLSLSFIVDVQLKHAKELTKNDIKLLMLGAGESGKTTIKQQMRAIEGQRMTEGERDQFSEWVGGLEGRREERSDRVELARRLGLRFHDVLFIAHKLLFTESCAQLPSSAPFQPKLSPADICRTNMVSSLQIILDNMSLMGLTLADASLQGQAELITGLVNENGNVGISPEDGELLPGVKEALLNLWRDASVQATYARSNEYQLNDSADYFLDNAERICQRGWRPNDMDVLKARVKTTGISETRFSKQGKNFVVVDVGGQRSERKKWLYCFEVSGWTLQMTACCNRRAVSARSSATTAPPLLPPYPVGLTFDAPGRRRLALTYLHSLLPSVCLPTLCRLTGRHCAHLRRRSQRVQHDPARGRRSGGWRLVCFVSERDSRNHAAARAFVDNHILSCGFASPCLADIPSPPPPLLLPPPPT